MDQVNGTTSPKKKQVLFSIGSYSERDRRVINKISANGLFASATTDDAAAMQPTRTLPKTRPVSLNFTDTTPKYKTLPARHHRYTDGLHVEKPACPPSSACNSPAVENGPVAGKPTYPPKFIDRTLSWEPEQLRHSGRVALTIAAYEGEPRTPTRLDFLPSGRVSRASSKASNSTASTPGDDVDGCSKMMLQNELVATLKRSNLKRLTEDDVFQNNGTPDSPMTGKHAEEPNLSKPIQVPENIKIAEELKNSEIKKEAESKPEIKEEIDAVLTELEKSTEEILNDESESIPTPPPMPESEKLAVREEPLKVDSETGKPKESMETVELSNNDSSELVKESKDETIEISNGSVKQVAVELGKKMTFKADIEKVPEQNGIKDE